MDRLFCISTFLAIRVDVHVEEQSICAQGSFACLNFLWPMTRLINKELKRKILAWYIYIRLACGRGKLILITDHYIVSARALLT